MRLLLAEDNEELSQFLIAACNQAGYDVDAVTTLSEARSALFSIFYASLILEFGLPDGNGLSLLKELRKKNRLLPVLILSASSSITDRVEGLRAGAEDFLVKPFATDELIARIEVLLRRGALERSFKLGNLELIIDQHGTQVFVDAQPQILPAQFQTTSLPSPCRPIRQSSTPSRTSGSPSARTSSPTGSTKPMRTSLMPVATPGTHSWPRRKASLPSPSELGQKRHNFWRLV